MSKKTNKRKPTKKQEEIVVEWDESSFEGEDIEADSIVIYGLFTRHPKKLSDDEKRNIRKLSKLFEPGGLYCLTFNTDRSKDVEFKRNNRKLNIPKESVPVFFNFAYETPFKDPISLPYETPLVYLGQESKWGSKIHVFLYQSKKVFTLGLFNSAPSGLWKRMG